MKSPNAQEPRSEPPHDASENHQLGRLVQVDVELYQTALESSDLTSEQKKEFLETMWAILTAFVDLGFGVHPVIQAQQKEASCELEQKTTSDSALQQIAAFTGEEARSSSPTKTMSS